MPTKVVSDNEKTYWQLGTVFLAGTTQDFLAPLADLTLIRQLILLNPTCFKQWFNFLGVGSSGCCDAICHPQTGLPSREHSCLWMVHRYVMYCVPQTCLFKNTVPSQEVSRQVGLQWTILASAVLSWTPPLTTWNRLQFLGTYHTWFIPSANEMQLQICIHLQFLFLV